MFKLKNFQIGKKEKFGILKIKNFQIGKIEKIFF